MSLQEYMSIRARSEFEVSEQRRERGASSVFQYAPFETLQVFVELTDVLGDRVVREDDLGL